MATVPPLPETDKPPLTMRVKLASAMRSLVMWDNPAMLLNTERNEGQSFYADLLELIFKIKYEELKAWLVENANNVTLSQFQSQMLTKMSSNVFYGLEGAVKDSLFCTVMVDQVVKTPIYNDMDLYVDEDGNFINNKKAVFVL